MVSTRRFRRANLYRAICHSFKNFLYLVPRVIDLTPRPQVHSVRISRCAPSGAFRFVHCLIYKVHALSFVLNCGTLLSYHSRLCLSIGNLISFHFFLTFSGGRPLGDSLDRIPPDPPIVKGYFALFWVFFFFLPRVCILGNVCYNTY